VLTLVRMNENFGICRLRAASDVPSWAGRSGSFFSIVGTKDELSVLCAQSCIPEGAEADRDWRGFKIRGPLDPSSIGVLSSILQPLAEGGIGILAVSTYETDYVFVKDADFARATEILKKVFEVI
jgi:hypothetical protein